MPRHATELPTAATAALARGEQILAIKLLRQSTGMSLKEAKDAVEAAAREEAEFSRLLAGTDKVLGGSNGLIVPPEASVAMEQGHFIEAIALLRKANPQLDLRSAQAVIDSHLHPSSMSTPQPRASNRHVSAQRERVPTVVVGDGNKSVWLLALVMTALAAALLWWLIGGG